MDVISRDGAFAESNVAAFTRSRAAFDLKGVMASMTVLRLRTRDLNLIERQLRAKVTQFPQFFQSAPIILDVGELEGGVEGFPLAALVRALSVCKVVPVAVTNIDDAHRHMAAAAGLGIVTLSASRPAGDPEAPAGEARDAQAQPARDPQQAAQQQARDQQAAQQQAAQQAHNQALHHAREIQVREHQAREQQAREAEAHAQHTQHANQMRTPTPTPAQGQAAVPSQGGPGQQATRPGAHRAPMVIRQAVRSGQLIYAEKNDLIVLAPVNPGAQIVADGNIHVYATLRGRAVAGAQGYTDARIFCQKFEAELVAIAGAHLTFDDIPRDRLGKPSQVHLQNGACVITAL
jgi:septum site-determining protein MinC